MVARRRSGKSVLIRDLLYHFRDFPIGTIICPTERLNNDYKPHVPPLFIHHSYREDIIEKVLKRQSLIIEKIKEDPEYADVDPHMFLLLDDLMFDDSWQKSTNIKEIFYNGRHYKLLMILSLQYVMGLSIGMRANLDWVFLLKEPILANKKRLYEYFAGMFPNQQVFNSVLDQVTEGWGVLVIHNSSTSNKIEDQVFWYRGDLHEGEEWRVCLDQFWDMSKRIRSAEDAEEQEEGNDDFARPFQTGRHRVQVDVRRLQ